MEADLNTMKSRDGRKTETTGPHSSSNATGNGDLPRNVALAAHWRHDSAHLPPFPTTEETFSVYLRSFKRILEYVVGTTLLILAAPLILLMGVLVKLTSSGPIFYSQTRLGRHGRPFRLYKIRTMIHNCETTTGACWAKPHDPRITQVGRLLRRTHLDELPQLWNVLAGDMSLIGPRPERPEFVAHLQKTVPHYMDRLLVRPGLTGLAQVQLPADTDLSSVRRKLAYDLYYIRHCTFHLDCRLFFCTLLRVFGVPFHVLCRLFAMPGQQRVESAYSAWRLEATLRMDLQST